MNPLKSLNQFANIKHLWIIIICVAFLLPIVSQAKEYNWLKNDNPNNIFVYANFGNCPGEGESYTEIVKGALSQAKIKASITAEGPVLWITDDQGKRTGKTLIHKFAMNQKPFLYVTMQCAKISLGYLSDISIRFAIIDTAHNVLLYEYPTYGSTGISNEDEIKTELGLYMHKAVMDYLVINFQRK